MRKGFFLTESEKNRISNLYSPSKFFLTEASKPMPTDVNDQIKFADWMDQKHPNWITKNDGSKVNSTGTKIRQNNTWAGSPSFKRAWDKYGDEYSNTGGTGGTGGSMAETQKKEFRYWDTKINDWSREELTKDEMTKAYNENKFSGSSRVYKIGMTYSNANYPMACQVEGLNIPCDPIIASTATGDAGIKSQYQSAIGVQGLSKPKFSSAYDGINAKSPEEFINLVNKNAKFNPYTSKNMHQYSEDGLKKYLSQIYGVRLPKDAVIDIDRNDNKATITIGNTVRTYYYNKNDNTWDLPQTNGNIELLQPKDQTDLPTGGSQ